MDKPNICLKITLNKNCLDLHKNISIYFVIHIFNNFSVDSEKKYSLFQMISTKNLDFHTKKEVKCHTKMMKKF